MASWAMDRPSAIAATTACFHLPLQRHFAQCLGRSGIAIPSRKQLEARRCLSPRTGKDARLANRPCANASTAATRADTGWIFDRAAANHCASTGRAFTPSPSIAHPHTSPPPANFHCLDGRRQGYPRTGPAPTIPPSGGRSARLISPGKPAPLAGELTHREYP